MKAQKIQAALWKVVLALLCALAFVAIGGIMLLGDTSLFEKIIGVLAVVFFGGFCLPAIWSSLVRRSGQLVIDQAGLQLHYPNSPVIPLTWQDIESFGTYTISGQHFTTIRLRSYDQLLRTLNPKDAQNILQKFKKMNLIGKATVVVGGLQTHYLASLLPKSSELQDFASFLRHSRDRYGGEFQIGWNMRDRKAAIFADFLQAQKEIYQGKSILDE
ncbi:MAG: STM3941 family protein [Bacteroidota bacterium]